MSFCLGLYVRAIFLKPSPTSLANWCLILSHVTYVGQNLYLLGSFVRDSIIVHVYLFKYIYFFVLLFLEDLGL